MKPGGSTFNIQNFIPHKSQKPKAVPEANRAKEFQRGTAGVPESAKEGETGLPEGSDIGLGARCRRFESCRPDQIGIIRTQSSKLEMCSDFLFQLILFFNKKYDQLGKTQLVVLFVYTFNRLCQ